ncbi:MAG: sigma-54-dependent transcriptional regulator, partial [Candidatus Cryptobacteroides sp.]
MKILVIDDERPIRSLMKEILDDEGYVTDVAEDGEVGMQMAEKERYDVIFCDIKMPNLSGEEVLESLKEKGVDSPVVMISGHGDIDTAVKCIKRGAFDFLSKPLDLNRILITIKNATDKSNLMKEAKLLKKKVYGQEMIGESPEILKVREMIDKVAPTDARV